MQDLELITKIQRQLKQLYQNIGDSMIGGGVEQIAKKGKDAIRKNTRSA